ncbi:MAG: PhzF family phenazine biosynthesis protein [Actinomycetota bacterium]|nr:PhzF family phenazine biosynthesis protein [Actinomycetota bacterium]
MTQRYVVADVFTDTPLEGNGLAVFLDATGLDGETMQRAARELNLSETVFVLRRWDGGAEIRIFTPFLELPFAGHPVLGTAFVLGEDDDAEVIELSTGAGVVPVVLTRQSGSVVFGEMEQPLPVNEPFEAVAELLGALGVAEPELPVQAYRNGPVHVYVGLRSEAELAALNPDLGRLGEFGPIGVSCFAAAGAEVKTRMFGPGVGVAEDPATGSAAGPLAVHLVRQGRIAYGTRIRIRQGEEIKRPSLLYAQVDGTDERLERVAVGGAAVIVARGEYRLR